MEKRIDATALILPLLGVSLMLMIWTAISLKVAPDLPSPLKTWQESQQYILNPFFKDGEMNQGILRFAFLSLVRVAKGFFLAIVIGTPLGFLLGSIAEISSSLRSGDSSAAADFALGLVASGVGDFQTVGAGGAVHHRAVRHVAHRDQYRDGRAQHRHGIFKRRPRA